jgi:hypothetical protein
LPKSLQLKAKSDLKRIWQADDKIEAELNFFALRLQRLPFNSQKSFSILLAEETEVK